MTSVSDGCGRVASRASAAMSMPGVQMPHCAAPVRRNAAWIGRKDRRAARPSTVSTVATVQLTERDETGAHRITVQADRAGAAVAGIAADLRAGQTKVVSQDLAEPPHRVAIDRDLPAVDPEGRRSSRHVGHASTCATARRTSVRAASRR